jgi:uncharacterized damage-inducible protein DinB
MRIADILLEDLDSEISNTRRTLERLPDDKGDWKPHEKSMALGKLAMHCATIPLFGYYILEDDGMDMANSPRPHADMTWHGHEAAVAALDENAGKLRARLAAATDEELQKHWKFTYGPAVISDATRTKTYRSMFFNHLVHHTSQLGVYLRLLDIPVPALYGPSADEQWEMK